LEETFPSVSNHMKYTLIAFLFLSSVAFGQELKTIATPDFKSPLPAEWKVAKGTWDVKDGLLVASELPAEKHAAVLWHQVALQVGVVECEFMLDGGKSLLLGCDGDRHVGRVVITPQAIKIMDDSTEVKGKTPSTLLATAKLDLKPGEWHKLRYEWKENRMAATLDGTSVEGSNENLGKKKQRWWFAVSGATVKFRNVKVSG
jgi:Domain of Unknown Function (DUF1080)